ncbi:MAG: M23 family metallopeptidase [Deltaproteobacteria bacterium]|nr:M23 family metallopeptidase [Deltaproteobacteria bacterium]
MSPRPLVPMLIGVGALLGVGLLAAAPSSAPSATPSPAPKLVPPLAGRLVVTSPFGWRWHPVTGQWSRHDGLDLAAPVGVEVVAPEGGVVTRIDVAGGERGAINGNAVFVRAPSRVWAFLHLSRVKVALGQTVRAGDVLGASGASGRVTGPHLHLQVTSLGGTPIDPTGLFPPGTFVTRSA